MAWKKEIAVVFALLCLFVNSGCRQSILTEDKIVKKANAEVLLRGLDVNDLNVYYDVNNVKWNILLNQMSLSDSFFVERFRILERRNYQALRYSPQNKQVIGGVLWIFIDRKTGDVITWCGEK